MDKHVVIYSHGFGVQKDDRGLLTDIAAALPEAENILFDYNVVDETTHTLTVAPLPDQVAKLQHVIAEARAQYPDATIDLVTHSQGGIVAALAQPEGIRRAMLLAPPTELNADRLVKLFAERPGSEINLDGVSRLARRDGSTTIVPAGYWQSLKHRDPVQLYNALSELTQVIMVEARQDEVLGVSNYAAVAARIEQEAIDANHDFTSAEARRRVVALVRTQLTA